MITVIPLFSLLNDDFDMKNMRVLPFFGAAVGDSLGLGNMPLPFFVAFTNGDL